MTAGPVPRVDIHSLSVGTELGAGGQGRVAAVSGFQVNGRWPAVLKVYSHAVAHEVRASALEHIVGFPRELPGPHRRWLDENTAWPAAVVEDNGAACGFLMRAVPDSCQFAFQTQTLGARRKLADISFLLNPETYLRQSGLRVTDRDRLKILKDLAEALSRLHSLGVIVGDLSPKNILFALDPVPACFLIDCDAVEFRGETVLKQVETPDWEIPDGERKATAASDAYKFGLLAIRLFARDQSARDPMALRSLSAGLGRLAELSQDTNPAQRPDPDTWAHALTAASLALAANTASARPATPPQRISVPIPAIPAVPAQPGTSSRATSSRRIARRSFAAAGGLAVVVAAVLVGMRSLAGPTTPPATPGPGASAPSAPSVASTAGSAGSAGPKRSLTLPRAVGQVVIGGALMDDPRAGKVATMLNTYFSGIDQHNYSRAASVFDPHGSFNPGNPGDVAALANGLSTTRDSDIRLTGLNPSGRRPARTAEVTFRSHQRPGYGPAGAAGQTCTIWHLTYTLANFHGKYLIDKAKGAHQRC